MPLFFRCDAAGCTEERDLDWIAERGGVRCSVHGPSPCFAFPPVLTVEGLYFLHHNKAGATDEDDPAEYPKIAMLIPRAVEAAYKRDQKGYVKVFWASEGSGGGYLEVATLGGCMITPYLLPAFSIYPVPQTREEKATGVGTYIYRSMKGRKQEFRAQLFHFLFDKAARRNLGHS